jgi:hypothetical protein
VYVSGFFMGTAAPSGSEQGTRVCASASRRGSRRLATRRA